MMMNNKVLIPVITILAAAVGAGLMYLAFTMRDDEAPPVVTTITNSVSTGRDVSNITTFEQCAAAGFPIRETFPEQCVADGKTFTRNVTPTTPPPTGTTPVAESEELSPTMRLKPPLSYSKVGSPLTVTGEAAGWYFEGEFPVRLVDANGTLLAQGSAVAQGNWMTSDFVPFTVTLTFSRPATDTGKLILEKSNPRGEGPADTVEVPLRLIN